nr:hypothetical protein BdHM001_35130 [Bdellovibrio sp. HM001]
METLENTGLAKKTEGELRVEALAYSFMAMMFVIGAYCLISIGNKLQDETIPVVICPKTYNLDSPVLLPVVRSGSIAEKDRYVKGFIRKLVINQFPRNAEDAKEFYTYVANRSKGSFGNLYKKLSKNDKAAANLISSGFYLSFYPKDSQSIRVRATSAGSQWRVEIDGYMVKKMAEDEVRKVVTLQYTVESGDVTISNPEGLYVTDSNTEEYKDFISEQK